MGSCRFTLAGCAVACRAIGYPNMAELILDDRLGPEAIACLFRARASKTWKRDAALIVLSGSIAKHRAHRETWSPELSASLARGLVGEGFGAISDTATRLVREHWPAIEALAGTASMAA